MHIYDDMLQYVMERVRIDPITGCWIWTKAGKTRPIFTKGNTQALVYRELWMYLNKKVLSSSEFLCHRCDNGMCCNPDHLFVGSPATNMKDMVSKGRHFSKTNPEGFRKIIEKAVATRKANPELNARGEKHGTKTKPECIKRGANHWAKKHPELIKRGSQRKDALFNDEQVAAIRLDKRINREIAIDYNCHQSTISLIKNGKHY